MIPDDEELVAQLRDQLDEHDRGPLSPARGVVYVLAGALAGAAGALLVLLVIRVG